jgi:hypothetical protein
MLRMCLFRQRAASPAHVAEAVAWCGLRSRSHAPFSPSCPALLEHENSRGCSGFESVKFKHGVHFQFYVVFLM